MSDEYDNMGAGELRARIADLEIDLRAVSEARDVWRRRADIAEGHLAVMRQASKDAIATVIATAEAQGEGDNPRVESLRRTWEAL